MSARFFNIAIFMLIFAAPALVIKPLIENTDKPAFIGNVTAWISSQSDIVLSILLLGMFLAMAAASFGISVLFYKRREF